MSRLVSLGEVAEVNPTLDGAIRTQDATSEVPFLPMASVSEGGAVTYAEERTLGSVIKGYTAFAKGDVLLAKITPCFENGKAAYLCDLPSPIGFGSTEFHVMRPGPELDGRYLFHFIRSPRFREAGERNMTGTAGQKRVPTGFLQSYKLVLPPLAEQRRIAALLDRADAVRLKRDESRRLVDELLRSVFLEMFGDPVRNERGWEVVRLGEVLSRPLRNGVSPSRDGKFSGTVLTLTAITGPHFDPTQVKQANFSQQPTKDHIATEGDLLICRGNGSSSLVALGKVVRSIGPAIVFPDTAIAATPDPSRVISDYLEAVWSTPMVRKAITAGSRTTSGIHKVNQALLGSVSFPLPPIHMQAHFSSALSSIRRVADRINDGATGAAELGAAFSQRLLSEE